MQHSEVMLVFRQDGGFRKFVINLLSSWELRSVARGCVPLGDRARGSMV
jgi:hypothetical protein